MNNQKKTIYLSPPQLNGKEINFIQDAINSNWIAPLGPHVDQFENEMANYIVIDYATELSSGTAALHLALKIIGVKSGDYLFCSDLTFVATVNAVKYLASSTISTFVIISLSTFTTIKKFDSALNAILKKNIINKFILIKLFIILFIIDLNLGYLKFQRV